jgi:hypothetical protein
VQLAASSEDVDAVVADAADAMNAKHSEQVVVFDGLSGYYEASYQWLPPLDDEYGAYGLGGGYDDFWAWKNRPMSVAEAAERQKEAEAKQAQADVIAAKEAEIWRQRRAKICIEYGLGGAGVDASKVRSFVALHS